MAYTKAVHSVHITEVVEPGTSVDVMILRNCYPQMLPFSNLRSVVLHRLSPSAFYKEEFVYTVSFVPRSLSNRRATFLTLIHSSAGQVKFPEM